MVSQHFATSETRAVSVAAPRRVERPTSVAPGATTVQPRAPETKAVTSVPPAIVDAAEPLPVAPSPAPPVAVAATAAPVPPPPGPAAILPVHTPVVVAPTAPVSHEENEEHDELEEHQVNEERDED